MESRPAHEARFECRHVHNRRRRAAARRAGVEQEIDAVAERPLDLIRIGGRRLAADVRARRGQRPAAARGTAPRATAWAGTRTPTRPVPPGHVARPAPRGAGNEQRQRSRPEPLGEQPRERRTARRDARRPAPHRRQSAAARASSARPFTANTRATACALNGSAARPYSVSVGSATMPPGADRLTARARQDRVAHQAPLQIDDQAKHGFSPSIIFAANQQRQERHHAASTTNTTRMTRRRESRR